MLLCVHTVIDHRRHQKCGKRISDTLSCTSCATFLFLPHYDLICDLLLDTDTWQRGIYLLNLPLFLKKFFKVALMKVVNALNNFCQDS